MDVVSFFAGCGGLDPVFANAGFIVVWENEFEPRFHFSIFEKQRKKSYEYLDV